MPRLTTVTLRPPAKVNLTLQVGPRRADGFHDVCSVMQSIALSDRLTLTRTPGALRLEVARGTAPADRTNLVWRAAELLWRASGRRGDPHGAVLTLEKTIPAGAGLGGGSADAAAALAGLNRLWNAKLSRTALLDLAAELGSDVPFFLVGGTALALGRGDRLYPLAEARRLPVVLILPPLAVSTAEAYGWFDRRGPSPPAEVEPAIDLGWPTGGVRPVNDLQAAVADRHPEIHEMVSALRRAGAAAATMSGSGSCVFGVFTRAPGPRALARLRAAGWCVVPTRTLTRREALRRVGLC